MCGIFFCLCKSQESSEFENKYNFNDVLSRRGPDSKNDLILEFNEWRAHFVGHVLWTQGTILTKQPITDEQGNTLLWNGDVFKENFVGDNENDSLEVLKRLVHSEDGVLSFLTQIIGPHSFVYWDNVEKRVWFGRDVIGRHSMLWCCGFEHVVLTSTSNKQVKNLEEVPSWGVYMIDLKNDNLELNFYPWKSRIAEFEFNLALPVNIREPISHAVINDVQTCVEWPDEEGKIIEVQIYKEIYSTKKSPFEIFKLCLENSEISCRVDSFIELLSKSVEVRVKKCPRKCRDCTNNEGVCSHCKVSVLFSGGLDSTVLALLADKYVSIDEPIDLYNVAFQNPTKKVMNFNVPDRKTGEKSLEELQKLCPRRQWNFIKIDVTYEELETWRHKHISHLIHPLNTVLDDSIGCVLWFASRGQGLLLNGELYVSSARVVLLGLGADEMLGGYMRHRTLWRHENSWMALGKSLAYDLSIIWQRNLGRDNRVIADHGRQPRLPYLDENVVAFIQSLPPWHRCCLVDEMPVGVGDKLLLRLSAWRLGLLNASSYPKRAMQFGSRIANSREKGNDISHRL